MTKLFQFSCYVKAYNMLATAPSNAKVGSEQPDAVHHHVKTLILSMICSRGPLLTFAGDHIPQARFPIAAVRAQRNIFSAQVTDERTE